MRRCAICNSPLSGKQQQFCSIRCRNVSAGRASALQHVPPDRGWLAAEYLLPPDGKGKTLVEIGKECGVSKVTVRKWLTQYGLRQDVEQRLSFFGSRPKPERKIPSPPKEELAGRYLLPPDGDGMTEDALAEIYGVSKATVRRWLDESQLAQPHSVRHSARMAGEGNPSYVNGNAQGYVKRLLSAERPPVCEWCGDTERVQIHHIDHDRENNAIENLMWLCQSCNLLEARINQFGDRATWHIDILNDEVIITVAIKRRGEEGGI